MFARLSFIFMFSLLTGCAAFKPPERSSSAVMTAGKLGYVAEFTSVPTHTHLGTTIFNNFTTQYDRHWDLEAVFVTALERELDSKGIELVLLETSDLPSLPFGIFEIVDDRWAYREGAEPVVQRLTTEFGLAGLLQLHALDRILVALECSNFGCNERFAEGMGLFTRGVFGLHHYFAVPAVAFRLEIFNPGYELSRYEPLVEFRTIDGGRVHLKEIDKADDIKALGDEQLIAVREAIEQYLEELARSIVVTLTVADPSQLDG
jgi:hypothetical protein